MTFINVITILCLLLMIVWFVSVIISLCTKKREDRITYVRGFKKGKGVLIYVFSFPLYWTSLVYSGKGVVDAFFSSIAEIIDLVVLKFDMGPVQQLVDANPIFAVAIYLCFVLITLNAIMVITSLASQYMWAYFQSLKFRLTKKERLVMFGNNAQNHVIYKSDDKRVKIIADKITDKDALALYMKNFAYTQIVSFDRYVDKTVGDCAYKGKKMVAIINTGDDDKNIELSRKFVKSISDLEQSKRGGCFEQLRVFVFGDPRYEAIYEQIVADGLGCISYVNKYQKIAIELVDKYPLTKFMDETHIDYDTSLVKEGVDINALMIGFGKTNQQIFLTSVANNQFVTAAKDGIELKKVRYHIFDKNPAENNKNLNHNYNRYKNECFGVSQDNYLPLPSYPAEEYYHHLDVNDVNFYNEIRRVLASSKKAANFVIIAFGSDLENIDMAQKLIVKAKEWEVKNFTIFVKVRKDCDGQNLIQAKNCFVIGNEKKAVYDIETILGDRIYNMAKLRNEVYDIEYEIRASGGKDLSNERVDQIRANAHHNWYAKKSQMERESNVYCALSLRTKLNLMGLDYCPVEQAGQALTEDEYLSVYAKDDMPDRSYYSVKAGDKTIIRYTLDFAESRRKNMAEHEHLRWNSFMISKGIVPATKDQILYEKNGDRYTNGKNYQLRRHGNLTTFEGLQQFRQMIADRDGVDQQSKDVIQYDYQILDDAVWLLGKVGQKIIKKPSVTE